MNCVKVSLLAMFLFQVCSAQIYQSEYPASYTAKQLVTVSTSFTDSSKYNSYEFAGNPLGKLESDTNLVNLDLGYRFFNSSASGPMDTTCKYNGLVLPTVSLRPSTSTLMSLNYSFNSLKSDNLSVPLHQFGFMMVSQAKKGVFKGGIAGEGFIGKGKQSDGDNTRALMGLNDVGICLGSNFSPVFSLDVYAHAGFLLDTLCNSNEKIMLQERYASVKLPQIDVTAGIKIPSIRDYANIGFTYAKQHFVYTEKTDDDTDSNSVIDAFHTTAGNNAPDNKWDADPIVNDSIAISLQNMVRFNLNDNVVLAPSISLKYMNNNFTRMKPGEDNHPFNYDGENSGYDWKTGSFKFGIGTTFELFKFTNIWAEYSFSSLKLTLGDKYEDSLSDSKSKGFNRFGIGSQINFARIPAFNINKSIDLALTVGYLFEEHNELLSSSQDDAFNYIQPMTAANTQLYRYTPWVPFGEKISSSGIQTGLHTSFMDETIVTDLYFIYANESISGINNRDGHTVQTGLDLILNVKGKSK